MTPLRYFFYRISGLRVQSDFELPGSLPADASAADVVVRKCDVPERLEAPTGVGPDWQMDDSRFLLSLPGIGRFLAADGRLLEMQPEGDARDAVPFLLGTALGALLLQRGNLVLHGPGKPGMGLHSLQRMEGKRHRFSRSRNRRVRGVVDPRLQRWNDHFELRGHRIEPLTPTGTVTLAAGAKEERPSVFCGNSSIRLWDTLAEDSIPACGILDSADYFFERLLTPLNPRS